MVENRNDVFHLPWWCDITYHGNLSGLTTPLLVLLEFFRWLCSSLVAPSWKVLGRAPSSMVNSGVLSSNKAISTTCAACRYKPQVRAENTAAQIKMVSLVPEVP